jgi:hypothetical protein
VVSASSTGALVTIRMENLMRPRLLVLLATLGAVPSAAAQITVTPIRDLAFGSVIAGIPSTVGPSHPTRSGQFRITAPLNSRVQVRFTVPDDLAGPAGAQLPITFGSNDAIAIETAPGSTPTAFNPKATRNLQFLGGTTYNVFIGGTVTAATNQRQGNYAATITLTVTNF